MYKSSFYLQLPDIVSVLISMEFSTENMKWQHIHHMTESIPETFNKGIHLRKQISYLALKAICSENNELMLEKYVEFDVSCHFLFNFILSFSG